MSRTEAPTFKIIDFADDLRAVGVSGAQHGLAVDIVKFRYLSGRFGRSLPEARRLALVAHEDLWPGFMADTNEGVV